MGASMRNEENKSIIDRNVRKTEQTWRMIVMLAGLLATISMAVTGFTVNNIMKLWSFTHSIDIRVSKIEANRWTSKDEANNSIKLWSVISELKDDIAQIPTEVPPKWFVDMVKDNRSRIEDLERRKR